MVMATSPIGSTNNFTGPDPSGVDGGMSPEALLAFCQIQLGALDKEVNTQMKTQELELGQRTAVEQVQGTLESFGDQGPQSAQDVQTCVDAFNTAIDQLRAKNPNDPIAAELETKCQSLVHKFNFQVVKEAGTPTVDSGLEANEGVLVQMRPTGLYSTPAHDELQWSGPLASGDWKGITDDMSNVVNDIKSNAEIQMLKLQDLVSHRQQVVELVTGMMGKEDQALEDGAKAIGR
jgi:hypothetical protein